jgi:hypothetical protein
MDESVISAAGAAFRRRVRVAVVIAVVLMLVMPGLFLLEGSGPHPVRPFGTQIVQVGDVKQIDGPNTTNNPNAGCKPKPPHDCRPPSGS